MTVTGNISLAENTVTGGITTESMNAAGVISVAVADYYDGAYTFTPSSATQTVFIKGKTALENITINPVPSNYGLITWDGAILTVS